MYISFLSLKYSKYYVYSLFGCFVISSKNTPLLAMEAWLSLFFLVFFYVFLFNYKTYINVSLQGSRVCAWEAFRQLAERCTRLGNFKEPLLGHTNPHLGQRWLWGGQENTYMHFLLFSRVLNADDKSLYFITHFVSLPNTKIVLLF